MKNPEVKSQDTVDSLGGLDFVPIEISAPLDWIPITKFLAAVGSTGKGVVVDAVSVPDENPPKVRIGLRLPLSQPTRPPA